MQTVFTTGQVAKICGVAPRTVQYWFDMGRLKGFKLPCGRGIKTSERDRRIPRANLIQFLREHGMPVGLLEDEQQYQVLLIGVGFYADRLAVLLPESEGYALRCVVGGFEAGIAVEAIPPNMVVIDLAMGRGEGRAIMQALRRRPKHETTPIIALASEDETGMDALVGDGFSDVFRKPFDVTLLASRVHGAKEVHS